MSVVVTVDDREPPSVAAAFRAHPEVDSVDVARLEAGDVAIGDIGFERKTAGDYLGSALGRTGTDLEKQVRAMTERYDQSYVLVEADLPELEAQRPGVADASVRGSLASITARFGVPVIPCGGREPAGAERSEGPANERAGSERPEAPRCSNREGTTRESEVTRERLVDVAVRLARKHVEEPSERALSPGAVPVRHEPVTKRMYGCIEGIGPGTAQALYEVYPTVEELLTATEDDLLAIDGVGPTRAAAIHDAFRTSE